MLPIFTFPIALAGLAALPTLAAIYWLRNRYRRRPVSSLMLWADHRQVREGGTRRHRLQTPFVFYLELLALLLLAVAAAGPHLQTASGTRPLLVVLDDSYSMTAGESDSPRNQAITAVIDDIRKQNYSSVRFLLAGDSPQVLGDSARTTQDAERVLRDWKCRAPHSRLDETMSLASELAGENALILVLSDRKPDSELGKGRIVWRAFGRAEPNIAFVNAARTARDGSERCLLEIANLSDKSQTTTLRITAGDSAAELQQMSIALQPQELRRIFLDLKPGTPTLTAQFDADALGIDNRVLLMSSVPRPVRVDIQILNKALRELVDKAVRATPGAELSSAEAELFVTDREALSSEAADAWPVRFVMEKVGEAYTGPFVIDRNHPLTEGLQLQGIVWGAGKTETLSGSPVVMAGNVPLLTDASGQGDRHEIRIRLKPELSTLPESPNWPILFWNLVKWRAGAQPGLSRANVRLGEDTVLTFPTPRESVYVTSPSEVSRAIPVHGRRVAIRADDVGTYRLASNQDQYVFAANALNTEESNLQQRASGRWGDWLDETTLRLEYQNIAWALLLLVLAALTLHGFLIARDTWKGRP